MTESRVAAFFDVDGTIVKGNIVSYYVFLRTSGMGALRRALWVAGFAPRVPYYIILDSISRRRLNRNFYRNYVKISPSDLARRAKIHFQEYMHRRLYPQALAQIEKHKREGHRIVLVTGSLDIIVQPLAAEIGADLVAARLHQAGGKYTGALELGPLTDKDKAQALLDYAQSHTIELPGSFAYADSFDDIAMLSTVGHPAVINPGRRLERVARQRGWKILNWSLNT